MLAVWCVLAALALARDLCRAHTTRAMSMRVTSAVLPYRISPHFSTVLDAHHQLHCTTAPLQLHCTTAAHDHTSSIIAN